MHNRLKWLFSSIDLFFVQLDLFSFQNIFPKQGFCLRSGLVRSFPIPFAILWCQYFLGVCFIFQYCNFFYLLFKENLSELQPCLRNWFLGSRNTGNSVSKCSIFKIPRGACPETPLDSSRLRWQKMSRPVLSEICLVENCPKEVM